MANLLFPCFFLIPGASHPTRSSIKKVYLIDLRRNGIDQLILPTSVLIVRGSIFFSDSVTKWCLQSHVVWVQCFKQISFFLATVLCLSLGTGKKQCFVVTMPIIYFPISASLDSNSVYFCKPFKIFDKVLCLLIIVYYCLIT